MGSEMTSDLVPTVRLLWPAVRRQWASPLGSPRGRSAHAKIDLHTSTQIMDAPLQLFFLSAHFNPGVSADADSRSDSTSLCGTQWTSMWLVD